MKGSNMCQSVSIQNLHEDREKYGNVVNLIKKKPCLKRLGEYDEPDAYQNADQALKKIEREGEKEEGNNNHVVTVKGEKVKKKRYQSEGGLNLNEKIHRLMNMEKDMELKTYKILNKNEDTNGFRRKKQQPIKLLKTASNNLHQQHRKKLITKELMQEKKQKIKKCQQLDKINDSLRMNSSNLNSFSQINSYLCDQFSKQSINQTDNVNKKVEQFLKKLQMKSFEEVLMTERRKRSNQAFLQATRKFNIKNMENIDDQYERLKKRDQKMVRVKTIEQGINNQKQNIWETDMQNTKYMKSHQIGKLMLLNVQNYGFRKEND